MPRFTVANRRLFEEEQRERHETVANNMKRDIAEDVFRYDTARTFCLLGMKGSGKTHMTLAWIYDALLRGTYDEIFAIIPCYEIEQHRSYEWLGQFKHVYVFTGFNEAIVKLVMDRASASPEKRRMLWVDDATEFIDQLNRSENMMNCFVTSRHVGVDLVIGAHAALKLFSPAMRANCDRILLFRFANSKVLQTIYEEWFSLSGKFTADKDFESFFRRYVLNDEYKTGHEAIIFDALQRDADSAWAWASSMSLVAQYNAALKSKGAPVPVARGYAKVCGTDAIDLAWDKTKQKKHRKHILRISEKGDYQLTGVSVDNPHYKPKPGASAKPESAIEHVTERSMLVGGIKRTQKLGKHHLTLDGAQSSRAPAPHSALYMHGPGYTFMHAFEKNNPLLFSRVWERPYVDPDVPDHGMQALEETGFRI